MNVRNLILLTGLSAFLLGCVVNPRPYYAGDYDYYDYLDTPSYDGYYYARIIFIGNIPYYVYDDRQVRPIPPHLREHFIRYPYQTLHRPPVFSRDKEVRDGYPMSRIIYLNGVPYNVRDNRTAEPLPNKLHQRFRYTPSSEGDFPGDDYRPRQPNQGRDDRHNELPSFGPARGNNEPPPGNVRDRDRMDRPLFEGGRQGNAIQNAPVRSNDQTTPPPGNVDSRRMPQTQAEHASPQQAKRNAAEAPRSKAQADNGLDRKDDENKKKSSMKKSDEKKDESKGDDAQPDDGHGRNDGKDNKRD
jgi:hypothetical protein